MSQHNERRRERNQVFENTSQHNEWRRERNQVFENTNQHNERRRERNQVFEITSQHNKRRRERNQVFDITSQHYEQRQERNLVFEKAREDNKLHNKLRGPLIWHASMWMENIYFIRHADYGMHLAFMVVGTFTYLHQHPVRGKNVAPMAACHLPVRNLMKN